MADTYTPNLNLIKQDRQGFVNVDKINANFDVLDEKVKSMDDRVKIGNDYYQIVTSTSRPINPTLGMEIYETDTRQRRIWNEAAQAWEITSNKPQGRVWKTIAQTISSAANTDLTDEQRLVRFNSFDARGGVTFDLRNDANYFTVPEKGYYRVNFNLTTDVSVLNFHVIAQTVINLGISGKTVRRGDVTSKFVHPATGTSIGWTTTGTVQLEKDDQIRLHVYHNPIPTSSLALSISGFAASDSTGYATYMELEYLGV